MIPLLHDFTGTRVLVFGGGTVGARKARRFAREAEVLVVSPAFADADFGTAALIRAAPGSDAIEGWLERVDPALVVAATDDEAINAAIAETARDRGVLVNRADRAGERDPGSVVVPATVRDGPVVVSVSTDGQAPAVSRHLRRELESVVEGAGEMADLCAELRETLKAHDVAPSRRREVVSAVATSSEFWTALRTGTANNRQVIEDVLAEELSTGGDDP